VSERTIAYVMEQTLGSVTHYLNLRRHESASQRSRPRWIPIEYLAARAPWTVTGSLRARRALRPVLDEVSGIFMHTTALAPLSIDYFVKRPTVLSCDGTPLNKRGMREMYGLKPEGPLAESAKRRVYREVFARARGFVAWSEWAKQSFVSDYGCREQDVAVIPPGIDLDQFSAGDRDHELPRMLFVGGDFVRKGGDLLLSVFRQRFRGRAELLLATRADIPEEPGVRVFRDLKANSQALRDLYATSDLFVLPTRADCYSLVCMEALASSLPLVATRVGGIPEIVLEGQTGHLIDADDAEALGTALESLITQPAVRRRMGEQGRVDAVRRFDAQDNARRLFEFVDSRC